MALIKCKECGAVISDKAIACPKCGCPIHLSYPSQSQYETYNTHGNSMDRKEQSAFLPLMRDCLFFLGAIIIFIYAEGPGKILGVLILFTSIINFLPYSNLLFKKTFAYLNRVPFVVSVLLLAFAFFFLIIAIQVGEPLVIIVGALILSAAFCGLAAQIILPSIHSSRTLYKVSASLCLLGAIAFIIYEIRENVLYDDIYLIMFTISLSLSAMVNFFIQISDKRVSFKTTEDKREMREPANELKEKRVISQLSSGEKVHGKEKVKKVGKVLRKNKGLIFAVASFVLSLIGMETSADEVSDGIGFDSDGDGDIDSWGMDTDGDGMVDTIASDMDGDGLIDSVKMDTDGDGFADMVVNRARDGGSEMMIDTNGDGFVDVVAYDFDGDGKIDAVN